MAATPRSQTACSPTAPAQTLRSAWSATGVAGRLVVTLLAVVAMLVAAGGRPVAARADEAAGQTATATIGDVYGGYAPDGGFLWLSDADLARNLDLMKESGARWIRLGVVWSAVEPRPGVFDWSTSDRVIAAARARGLEVLAILTYAPAWASGSDDDKVAPQDPTKITGVARAAADRYAPQGVHAWEIWNEPNLRDFWAPNPNAAAYSALLRSASAGIRAGDPRSVIVSGGLAPAGDSADGSTIAPLTFLNSMYAAGAGPSFDAVGLHPYCFPAVPMQTGSEGWSLFSRAPLLKQAMNRNGDLGKKIWFTEFGAPTGTARDAVSDAVQTETIKRAFEQLPLWSWAGPLFLYSLRDNGSTLSDREQNFGLLHRDYSAKPAWAAAVTAMHVAAPRTATGPIAESLTPPAPAPTAAPTAAPAAAPTAADAPADTPTDTATDTAQASSSALVGPPVPAADEPVTSAPVVGPPVASPVAAPVVAGPVVPAPFHRPAAPVRLSGLNATQVRNGQGPVERNLSNGGSRMRDGRTLSVGGRRAADGLGVSAGSSLTYSVKGAYRYFTATVGIDDEVGARGSVVFEVYSDGALRYRSGVVTGRSAARTITVPVLGARTLRLVVRDAGDGSRSDHADWSAARLVP